MSSPTVGGWGMAGRLGCTSCCVFVYFIGLDQKHPGGLGELTSWRSGLRSPLPGPTSNPLRALISDITTRDVLDYTLGANTDHQRPEQCSIESECVGEAWGAA